MRWPVTRRQVVLAFGSVIADLLFLCIALPVMLGIVQFLTNGNQFLLKTYAPSAFEFLRVREHLWEFLLVAPYFFCSGLVIYAVARRRWTLLKKTADPTTQRLMEAGEKLTGFKQN